MTSRAALTKASSSGPPVRGRAGGGQRLRPQLVSPGNFLLATRDTGYKNTALAVAEFIDNALQAGAQSVSVEVLRSEDAQYPIELRIIDDGAGMAAEVLATALTFGGSTRFDDRTSLGRYGMGLPNGALSRARRIEVYTWQGEEVLWARLDVDEIVSNQRRTLPPVAAISRPPFVPGSDHGTAVWLRRCDRIEYRRPSALCKRLSEELGRIYRHYLQKRLSLQVNGSPVAAVDPLFLSRRNGSGARQFGERLSYEFTGPNGPGTIDVTFSELPVELWHSLSTDEKRRMGITNAPSVSIVRANREVDRGWYFMGGKRRENYDDWWRCEVRFEPSLDELFGITHAKQAISPTQELLDVLVPDMEPIARALNSRVRRRFELAKVTTALVAAERQASRADPALPRLNGSDVNLSPELKACLAEHRGRDGSQRRPYRLIIGELSTTNAFEVGMDRNQLVVAFNIGHPLVRDLYGPLATSESPRDQDVAKQLALMLLAAARAEVGAGNHEVQARLRAFRQSWADVLATFFNA
jgi:Histidine kinase-, DNA gyrase B-, and HSP90-like ATPase